MLKSINKSYNEIFLARFNPRNTQCVESIIIKLYIYQFFFKRPRIKDSARFLKDNNKVLRVISNIYLYKPGIVCRFKYRRRIYSSNKIDNSILKAYLRTA